MQVNKKFIKSYMWLQQPFYQIHHHITFNNPVIALKQKWQGLGKFSFPCTDAVKPFDQTKCTISNIIRKHLSCQ